MEFDRIAKLPVGVRIRNDQLPTMRWIQILDAERLQSAEKLGVDTDRRFCGYFQNSYFQKVSKYLILKALINNSYSRCSL